MIDIPHKELESVVEIMDMAEADRPKRKSEQPTQYILDFDDDETDRDSQIYSLPSSSVDPDSMVRMMAESYVGRFDLTPE